MSTSSERPIKYPIATAPKPTKYKLQSPRGPALATRFWSSRGGGSSSSSSSTRPPNALVLLVHGGGWHSGYFDGLANALTTAAAVDCIVGSYDQVGCGYSDREPGTPPGDGINHINSFDDLVDDMYEAVRWLRTEAKAACGGGGGGGSGSNWDVDDLPLFLIGESFGGLQVIDAAFQADRYNVSIAGVITLGGLLQVNPDFLPPTPVVKALCFLARYYPRIVMPATDFETTYDDAFGDEEWAWTTRNDPKIVVSPRATIGMVAAILGTGQRLRGRPGEFPRNIPFMAIHGRRDTRTSPQAMEEWVDQMKKTRRMEQENPSSSTTTTTIHMIDTSGHQLLQDRPEIIEQVTSLVRDWILEQQSQLKS